LGGGNPLHPPDPFRRLINQVSEVSGVGDFQAVLKQSVVADFSYGQFRFLNLDALIASKKAVGRDRDLTAVRLLLAIKERNEQ
jgi:hypothetical protein